MLFLKQKSGKIMQCRAVCQGGGSEEVCAAHLSLHQRSSGWSLSPRVCGVEM